jgi:acetyltransferase-like isoleucine patch superfamily enzyme
MENMPQTSKGRPFEDPLFLFPKALTKIHSLWVSLTYPFASIGHDVSFHFTSKVSRQRSPRISLGNSVTLLDRAWLNVATEDPAGEPTIVIEDGCQISYDTIISGKNQVHLERDVLVGQNVVIQDHHHAYEDIKIPIVKQGISKGGRIRIGEGSWIGRGAAILCSRGELSIGRHCVVSANSMVTRSIPDYSVVFGMPATIIRQYDPETRAWRMGQLRRGDADFQNIDNLGSMDREPDLVKK